MQKLHKAIFKKIPLSKSIFRKTVLDSSWILDNIDELSQVHVSILPILLDQLYVEMCANTIPSDSSAELLHGYKSFSIWTQPFHKPGNLIIRLGVWVKVFTKWVALDIREFLKMLKWDATSGDKFLAVCVPILQIAVHIYVNTKYFQKNKKEYMKRLELIHVCLVPLARFSPWYLKYVHTS